MGDISSLFIQEFAGLKPNPRFAGVNDYEVSPQFVSALHFAEAYYHAPAGTIFVRWEKTPSGVTVSIRAPKETTGRLILPKGYALPNGSAEMPLANINGTLIVTARKRD